MNNKNNQPLLSVCMLSYNHEKFIKQALDSVLMQKVNFEYEIIVGEDCSTDNTRKILIGYKDKYPDLFNLILQKTNTGGILNFIDTLNACTGKYIAYLETDDYWIDEYKLQKQIDFLESNPDFGMVHTKAQVVNENNNVLFFSKSNHPSGDVFDYLIFIKSFIMNCSVCYRKKIIDLLLEKVEKNKIDYLIDYYLWVHTALYSKIYFLDEVTSVHRSHPGGITKINTKLHRRTTPYILTDIIYDRFKISNDKAMRIKDRFKYGAKYSEALLSGGMRIKDKIKRSSFYIKHFYLVPTIFTSFISKLYSYTRRKFQFRTIY